MKVSPESTRIGWIGTGVMGRSMCGHLLEAGYEMTVFTRTKAKASELLDRGATWVDSPREVAAVSDITCSIVGFPNDVHEVILGEQGVLAGCESGNVVIDFTTSRPALAVEIAEAAAALGVRSVDAPVSGGDIGAREAKLSIMIGGEAETVIDLEPVFKVLGAKWVRQGGPGAGQHTKMVNQTLIASGMIAVSEGLLYGYKAGLNLETVLESVASAAAGSWSLSNLGTRMMAGNFDPGFFVEHFIKDMGIALDEARRMGLALPGLAMAHQLYVALASQGHAKSGTQALILALGRLSGIDWEKRGA
jgi:3-hydroxyisobutyrate dehydrogenase